MLDTTLPAPASMGDGMGEERRRRRPLHAPWKKEQDHDQDAVDNLYSAC